MRANNIKFLAVSILVVIVGVLFLVYFLNASRNMASQDSLIANLTSQVTSSSNQARSLTDQLNLANTQNTTLTEKLNTANGQVTTLQSKLDAAGFQNTSLQSQLTSANGQISSLQNQLTSAGAQVPSLQKELADANTQISSLQSQLTAATSPSNIANLQFQLDTAKAQIASYQDILSLKATTSVVNDAFVEMAAGQETQVGSFTATYAGYIAVVGRSNSATSYIRVEDTFFGFPANYHYPFKTGDTVIIPVLPGTVTVYFGNTDSTGAPNATLSVIYYY